MQQEAEAENYQNYSMLKQHKMKFKVPDVAVILSNNSKLMYPQFNLFQLQLNRFQTLPQFAKLTHQILEFNQELQSWKKRDIQIKNLYPTYHLYQNLFSRMKYTSSFILDRTEAKRAYAQISRWFIQQKPKIRNQAPQKEEGKLKPTLSERQTQSQIESLLVSNKNKKEMRVYESMARTSHSELFPPKQRLVQYKRKELLQGLNNQNFSQKRASSVTTFTTGTHKYKHSLATTKASFFKTATHSIHTKQEYKLIQPIVVPFQMTQVKQIKEVPKQVIQNQVTQGQAKQKLVQQEQTTQKNLAQVVNEQDQADGEQDIQSDSENKQGKAYRKYKEDNSPEATMVAQEQSKEAKNSTLRRVIKVKEESVRTKLQQLSVAQQLNKWGANKGGDISEEHRKLERIDLVNKYNKLKYVPRAEQTKKNRISLVHQLQYSQNSKNSNPIAIQQQVQKIKINNALKTYSKYINHIELKPISLETEEQKSQMRVMRATSLTSFCRQGKKSLFSSIVANNGVETQNEQGFNYMITIKDRLTKTGVSVEKREIVNALAIVNVDKMDLLSKRQVYPPKKNLLNNPFFPKDAKNKKRRN